MDAPAVTAHDSPPPLETSNAVVITTAAMDRIRALRAQKNSPDLALRVLVTSGGCAGFLCAFSLENPPHKTDDKILLQLEKGLVVMDEISAQLLAGTEIDYIDELVGARFEVIAPKGRMGCSCGQSLSL